MYIALQYEWWVHLTAACSGNLQSFVHGTINPSGKQVVMVFITCVRPSILIKKEVGYYYYYYYYYLTLINKMSTNYGCVKFVNLSTSSLGVFSDECSTFLDMMNDIGIDKKQQLYIIKKIINIAIRATYYIFCCRNRNWDSPDLMQFWFFFLAFVLFCFLFFSF